MVDVNSIIGQDINQLKKQALVLLIERIRQYDESQNPNQFGFARPAKKLESLVYSEAEVCELLNGVATMTLWRWRQQCERDNDWSSYPPFREAGGSRLYPREAFIEWLNVRGTSAKTARRNTATE